MTTQTLMQGSTIESKYASLGFQGRTMVYPPDRLYGLVAGMPACGKSAFFQSCPDALIYNLDLSSTSCPNPKATIWPGIAPDGQPCDHLNNPIQLTWDLYQAHIARLFEMKDQGLPVPSMVVMDSLANAIALTMEWVIKKQGKDEWRQLDGRMGWDMVYTEIMKQAADCRQRGFGFYFTCHITNAKTQIGEDRWAITPELTITPGFWKRLFPLFEFVAVIDAEWQTKVEKYTETLMLEGKEKKIPKTRTRKIRRHYLTTSKENYAGITKGRTPIEMLELPEDDPWGAFVQAYEKARS
jgi:hypothetical protein